jgi:ABC-type uncharacterized transport system YnjBCD ATPase subunit
VIWLEGVSCQRDGATVLDTVTLGVASSDLIVIEGAAASGKSTLLELAAAVRMPDRGAVWFAGRNTAGLQRASLPFVRRNIGYFSSDSLLLVEDTALANVMMALAVRGESPARAEQAARDALALVKASDLENRKVASLSSGQKRDLSPWHVPWQDRHPWSSQTSQPRALATTRVTPWPAPCARPAMPAQRFWPPPRTLPWLTCWCAEADVAFTWSKDASPARPP